MLMVMIVSLNVTITEVSNIVLGHPGTMVTVMPVSGT